MRIRSESSSVEGEENRLHPVISTPKIVGIMMEKRNRRLMGAYRIYKYRKTG